MQTTGGTLLGGRIAYAQPEKGFRSGIEPVLLAAAIPARAGERVIEAGTGAGAALLCLAARVPGIAGLGVERDPALAALARANITSNAMDGLTVLESDIAALGECGVFDHGFANPPYHAESGTPSPLDSRERSKRAPAGLLPLWARALAHRLRPRGTLTLIVPAAVLTDALAALADAACGSAAILPLWPKAGRAAKLLLIHGVKGGRGPSRVLPGLVLHGSTGSYTDAAEAILRDGADLKI